MKLGISVSIDVKKIDKARLFEGQKGLYLDLTTFIDTDETDQYDNHGFISQSTTKEERAENIQTPILGNVKVFYKEESAPPVSQPSQSRKFGQPSQFQNVASFQPAEDNFSDDIPF